MRREVLSKSYPGLPKDVKVVVAPQEADIPDPRLKALFNRWKTNQLVTKHGLVSKDIIEEAEFLPLLRNVMLLEIERPTIEEQPFSDSGHRYTCDNLSRDEKIDLMEFMLSI